MLVRNTKERGKRFLHKLFLGGQLVGINVLPKHFYSQIPDIRKLRKDMAWRAPLHMYGISGTDLRSQIDRLTEWLLPIQDGHDKVGNIHAEAVANADVDGGYGEIEATVLYGFVVTRKPRRIVQIGCGVSTAVILAASRDAGYSPNLLCIEPFPSDFLMRHHQLGVITLIPAPAQELDNAAFAELSEGDLLFIDSTHTVKPGSEVNRLVLEVLPCLSSGVFVHFHDIYFPFDYQRRFLSEEIFFHSESTLVQAFLVCNSQFRIEASLSMLHYGAPDELRRLIPQYEPQTNVNGLAASGGKHFPSSLWLRRISQ